MTYSGTHLKQQSDLNSQWTPLPQLVSILAVAYSIGASSGDALMTITVLQYWVQTIRRLNRYDDVEYGFHIFSINYCPFDAGANQQLLYCIKKHFR